jgi:hypothetical protein
MATKKTAVKKTVTMGTKAKKVPAQKKSLANVNVKNVAADATRNVPKVINLLFTGITQERWKYYRQRAEVPLWIAVALTMNLDPKVNEAEFKLGITKAQREKFLERKKIAISAHGRQKNGIPIVEHHAAGKNPGTKYASLEDVLIFAEKNEWHLGDTLEYMREGLQLDSLKTSSNDQYPEKEENGKGAVYNAIRTGALLKLIEQLSRSPDGKIPSSYLHGGKLNFSKLGEAVSKLIKEKATANGSTNIKAHERDAVADQFSKAMKIFEDVGKKKTK